MPHAMHIIAALAAASMSSQVLHWLAHADGQEWQALQWRHSRLVAAARDLPAVGAAKHACAFDDGPLMEQEREELEALRRDKQQLLR